MTLQLLRSYLSERTQEVFTDGCGLSRFRAVNIGVPQGSILGSIFFILFINTLPTYLECHTVLYSDDTTLTTVAETQLELEIASQANFKSARAWFENNNLTLNTNKTETINFEMDRWKTAGDGARFLGVFIDPRLTWETHINQLRKKLAKTAYCIRRTAQVAGREAALISYHSLFHSSLSYGIETWGNSSRIQNSPQPKKGCARHLNVITEHTL